MHFTVYKITNKINGKIYIGKHQTNDINDSYMGSGKLIRRAQKKYGIENFSKEILFDFDSEELMNAKEAELVTEEFCLREDNYNLCSGGHGGFSYINRTRDHSQHNNKLARNRSYAEPGFLDYLNNKHGLIIAERHAQGKYKNKFPESALLNAQSEEAKKKRKNTLAKIGHSQGEKNSQFGSMWITNGIENKKIKKLDFIPEGWYKGRK